LQSFEADGRFALGDPTGAPVVSARRYYWDPQRDRDRTVERLPVVRARPVSVRRRTSRLLDLDSDLTIPSTLDLKQRLALAV